jgi:hypothetical protein
MLKGHMQKEQLDKKQFLRTVLPMFQQNILNWCSDLREEIF